MNSAHHHDPSPPDPRNLVLTSTVSHSSGVTLCVGGEIDIANAAQLSTVLTAHLTRAKPTSKLCVDLSQVTFLGVHGARALENAALTARDRPTGFALTGCRPFALRVLELFDLPALARTQR